MTRACEREGCSVTFHPATARQVYCTDRCRAQVSDKRKYEAEKQRTREHGYVTDSLRLYTTQNDVALDYDDPRQVRADIRAVLDNEGCWLTEAYDCALHAERLLDEVAELRAQLVAEEEAA